MLFTKLKKRYGNLPIFSVMARLLYVIATPIILAFIIVVTISQLWIIYYIITGRNWLLDIHGLKDDVKEFFNVP